MFLFLVSEKGTEKADLGAAAPKYPAMSRANADAPHRLIRTRLLNSKNFAFAASKRTAKIEKLTNIGIEALSDLFGGKSLRFKPRCARIVKLKNSKAFEEGPPDTVHLLFTEKSIGI